MKTLPTQLFKSGYAHLQLHRDGMVAMFRRWKDDIKPHFEVVVIGSHNGFKVKGDDGKEVLVPPAETYPTSEQWGSKGFTFNDEEAALIRFRLMAAGQRRAA